MALLQSQPGSSGRWSRRCPRPKTSGLEAAVRAPARICRLFTPHVVSNVARTSLPHCNPDIANIDTKGDGSRRTGGGWTVPLYEVAARETARTSTGRIERERCGDGRLESCIFGTCLTMPHALAESQSLWSACSLAIDTCCFGAGGRPAWALGDAAVWRARVNDRERRRTYQRTGGHTSRHEMAATESCRHD